MRQQLNEHKKSIPIKVECKINYETLTHTGTSNTTMTLTRRHVNIFLKLIEYNQLCRY